MKPLKKILLLLLTACLTLGILFLYQNTCFPEYTAASCRESVQALNNPYAGWYQIYGYSLTDEEAFDSSRVPENSGPGLVLLQINLRNYADTPVSDAGLRQLDAILKAWQSAGRQLILRFLYDWDGNAQESEPETLTLVLTHMSQTAEIINAYADCVYLLQGIFVGNWGEMHGSRYMAGEDMLTLAEHLASVTDPRIFLSVRTPEQWRTIAGSSQPLSPKAAFDGSVAARLGLFNDGMLGSETDLGTYAAADASFAPSDFGKRLRQSELLFQAELCRYVPNGGEVVIDNPYNDFSNAVHDLACSHVSYLNSTYDETVFSKWKMAVWQGSDAFNGMNGYDYISRHLGYRYCVRSSDFNVSSPWNDTASLSVLLENTGFSNSCRSFDVCLVLVSASGRESLIPIPTDTRLWDTDAETRLEVSIPVGKLASGTYQVFLRLWDPASGAPVLLANEGADEENGCLLGSLSVGRDLLRHVGQRLTASSDQSAR